MRRYESAGRAPPIDTTASQAWVWGASRSASDATAIVR